MEKYYYDDKKYNILEKYYTLWSGFLKNNNSDKEWFKKEDIKSIDDIIVEICEQNLYTAIDDNHLYISMDSDEKYYYYEFEKHIFPLIKRLEKDFNIFIEEGEFHAFENKPFGNQYRYNIFRSKKNKINLKKNVLNWENYDKLKSKIK
tara:strand:- start:1432 stop:1875 length:444 start_codon:yes stop_codon:yes gene_type:complete